jgi:hypothetical protein
MRTRRSAVAATMAALIAIGLFAGTATAAERTRQEPRWWSGSEAALTLVHGIDGRGGFPVDISVYRLAVGSTVYDDVTYGTVAGSISTPAGIYRIALRAPDAPRSTPILSKWIWLGPGANRSVVAHLKADGSPTLSVYRNDVSDSSAGARVTVRHNAAVGPVNVFANGDKVISRLANPDEATLDIPATTLHIKVRVAGGPKVFDADLAFARNTNTIVYATLDRSGNFNPLLQVLPTA